MLFSLCFLTGCFLRFTKFSQQTEQQQAKESSSSSSSSSSQKTVSGPLDALLRKKSAPFAGAMQAQADTLLLRFLTSTMQPFALTCNPEFRDLLAFVSSGAYADNIPRRTKITALLDEEYEKALKLVSTLSSRCITRL